MLGHYTFELVDMIFTATVPVDWHLSHIEQSATLIDPVMAASGDDRSVIHVQGSIGKKNMNITASYQYQLIPHPSNAR